MKEFENVIGYASVKKTLSRIADMLKNEQTYKKLGAKPPVGVLIYGEPGLGKTLMAKALIAASGRKAFTCRKNLPNGEFIKSIRQTFREAAENAPSIVFMDDMDKFANGDEHHRDTEEFVTVQSCIDEVAGKDVFILATANNVDVLPESLLRVGRFDRTFEIAPPNPQDAEKIIAYYLKDKNCASDFDMKTIARLMENRSCAELETVMNEAAALAAFDGSGSVHMKHFVDACLQVCFDHDDSMDDGEPLSGLSEQTREEICFHEAAHAVVMEVLCPGSVTLACVKQNAERSGFVMYYHGTDVHSADYYRCKIAAAVAGKVGTELRTGKEDAGCTNDLHRACRHASHLVRNLAVRGIENVDFHSHMSQAYTVRFENACYFEVNDGISKAREVLRKNRKFWYAVADALMRNHMVGASELQKLKADCEVTAVAV